MRIVRDYFGLDRTTVTYENEISGVGGNADEFFVEAEGRTSNGARAVRTTVHFTHEEMAHLLADYRQNHPIEGTPYRLRLPRQAGSYRRSCARELMSKVFGFRRR